MRMVMFGRVSSPSSLAFLNFGLCLVRRNEIGRSNPTCSATRLFARWRKWGLRQTSHWSSRPSWSNERSDRWSWMTVRGGRLNETRYKYTFDQLDFCRIRISTAGSNGAAEHGELLVCAAAPPWTRENEWRQFLDTCRFLLSNIRLVENAFLRK